MPRGAYASCCHFPDFTLSQQCGHLPHIGRNVRPLRAVVAAIPAAGTGNRNLLAKQTADLGKAGQFFLAQTGVQVCRAEVLFGLPHVRHSAQHNGHTGKAHHKPQCPGGGGSSAPAANETQQNMRNVFLAAGAGGIIQYWLRSGMQTEPGQVAAVIAALCEGAALAAMPQ